VTNRLTLAVIPPEASAWNGVELAIIVDGQDVVGQVFDRGPRRDPDDLLGPTGPLLPGVHPHEVRLATAICTECCHGALYTRIRRDGDEIVWDRWRNPDVARVDLGVFRFSASQYEAELARTHHDRGWEWPGRTTARLLRQALDAEPAVMQQWNSSLDSIACPPGQRDRVHMVFTSPPQHVLVEFCRLFNRLLEYRQYRLLIPVTDKPPAAQAEHAMTTLRATDPRESAELCGGYGKPPRPPSGPASTVEPDR
jgi:hypothetical protein